MAEDPEVFVFGSQAILGNYATPPESLVTSIEVDMQPKNLPEKINVLDWNLGEISSFHNTFGYYVHGLSIKAATLPEGWEKRTVQVSDEVATMGNIGHCLETHDLAASKLFANREKDKIFVSTLLIHNMIHRETLVQRIRALPIEPEKIQPLSDWVSTIWEEIEKGRG